MTRSQLELANQIEQAKADMAKLRGQIEVVSYELEASQKRQKDFYVDLDNRLRKLETTSADAETKLPQVRQPKPLHLIPPPKCATTKPR